MLYLIVVGSVAVIGICAYVYMEMRRLNKELDELFDEMGDKFL